MRKVAGCLVGFIIVLSIGIASSAPAGTVTIQFPSGFNFALSGGNLYDASEPEYGKTTAVNNGVNFFYNSVLVGTIPSGALADLLITGIPPIPTDGSLVTVSGGTFHFDLLTPGYGPNSGVKLTFDEASVSYLDSGQFFLSFTTTGTVAQQEMDYPFGQFWFDVGPNTYVNFAISGKVENPQYDGDYLISFEGVTSPSGNLNGPGGYIPEPASLVIWSVLGAGVCLVAWRARAKK
jgi:hypothetical protein